LYSFPSMTRITEPRMRWAGHVVWRGGEKRNACRLLVGKPEEEGPLGRPKIYVGGYH
jgi:hypothetical protein